MPQKIKESHKKYKDGAFGLHLQTCGSPVFQATLATAFASQLTFRLTNTCAFHIIIYDHNDSLVRQPVKPLALA